MNDNSKPGRITEGVCFTTNHIYQRNGTDIPYTCHAKEFCFVDELGEPEASFFIYTYLRDDVEKTENRPVIFSYGGGPGNASTQLHFWGPKAISPLQKSSNPPYEELIDNPAWIIDVCDIVCLDPPGAGYGKIYQYDKRLKYWGMEPDALIFTDMIKFWLSKYQRWTAPKYICGCSYGGIRTAMLTDLFCGGPYYTEQRQYTHGIALNGAILSATSLMDINMQNLDSAGIRTSSANNLMTFAAINAYYYPEGKPPLKEFVEETYHFAADEYLRAQWLGNDMADDEKTAFLDKLSYYTGIPAQIFLQYPNYDIPVEAFTQLLIPGKRLSLYDGRQSLPASDDLGFYEDYADDSMNATGTFLLAPLTKKFNREFLGINWDREWTEVNFDVNMQWDYTSNRTTMQHLVSAMRRNPDMHILIYGGMYDLAAPFGANRDKIRHSSIDTSNLTIHESPNAGHGVCSTPETMEEFGQALRQLFKESLR